MSNRFAIQNGLLQSNIDFNGFQRINDATPGGGGGAIRVTTVSYAATVTPNVGTTDLLIIGALTGPLTIANPTGVPADGQKLLIRVKQDASGSRTVTLGAIYRIPSSATIPLAWSTAASKTDLFAVMYNAADTKWDVISLVPGY
jgi:hypothetical protein